MVASARSVLQIERDDRDPDIRVLRQIKNSLGPSDAVMRFEIRKDTGFRWMEMERPYEEYAQENEVRELVFSSKTEKAAYLIRALLKDGKVLSNEMYQRLKEEGISHRTAEKTRLSMGVICRRVMNRWYWSLPDAAGEEGSADKAKYKDTGERTWKTR